MPTNEQTLFRRVVEEAPYAILLVDPAGRIVLANAHATVMLGYEPAELVGLDLDRLVPAAARSAHASHRASYAHAPYTRRMAIGMELTAVRRDGTEIPVEVGLTPLAIGDQQLVLASVTDISARRAAERKLRASEQLYRDLADGAPDIVFRLRLNDEPVVEYVNDAVEVVTGYPVQAFLDDGSLASRVIAPEDIPRAAAAMSGRSPYRISLRAITRSGETRWIDAHVSVTRDVEGVAQFVQGIARDVTEQRRVEEALSSTQAQLTQAQKMEAVGRLAGGIAHDFNNLITAILTFSEFVAEGLAPGDPALDDITQVLDAGQRAASLTKQLLAFSRKTIVEPRVIEVNDYVANVDKIVRRLLGEDIRLVVKLEPSVWPVCIDPSTFEQVLMNLAVNARDAMPTGGTLTIETRNERVDAARAHELGPRAVPGDYVTLAVTDDGCGMSPETQQRLFEPFFTTKAVGRGTGLGLSTCYGIVQQAGGFILVDSALDEGTTFEIYLPRSEAQPAEPHEAATSTSARGVETVLVAEDDPQVRQLTARVLLGLGYRVLAPAYNEVVTVAAAHGGRIDLLLTDVIMPLDGGAAVARQVAERHPAVKILFMTGYTEEAIVHHGVLEPGVALLRKPFTPAKLAAKVREVLDARRVE